MMKIGEITYMGVETVLLHQGPQLRDRKFFSKRSVTFLTDKKINQGTSNPQTIDETDDFLHYCKKARFNPETWQATGRGVPKIEEPKDTPPPTKPETKAKKKSKPKKNKRQSKSKSNK